MEQKLKSIWPSIFCLTQNYHLCTVQCKQTNNLLAVHIFKSNYWYHLLEGTHVFSLSGFVISYGKKCIPPKSFHGAWLIGYSGRKQDGLVNIESSFFQREYINNDRWILSFIQLWKDIFGFCSSIYRDRTGFKDLEERHLFPSHALVLQEEEHGILENRFFFLLFFVDSSRFLLTKVKGCIFFVMVTHWAECSRSIKLTALLSNSPIKLTALLFIRAVIIIGLFHLWKIDFNLGQTGWISTLL